MADRKEKLAEWLAQREKEKVGAKAKIKFAKVRSMSWSTFPKSGLIHLLVVRHQPTFLGPSCGEKHKHRSMAQEVLRETFSYQQKKTPFSKSSYSRTGQIDENEQASSNVNLFVGSTPCPTKYNKLRSEFQQDHMTPARLEFNDQRGKSQMSCQKLREKLQAHSIRKQKLRQVKREVKKEPCSKPDVTAEPRTKTNVDQVRFNNLKKTVQSQVSATQLLMKNCQFKEAKGDLAMLVEEIPEATQIGEFWVTLAQVEQRLKGRNAALMVYALAFDELKQNNEESATVQKACKQLILQNFRMDGYSALSEILPASSSIAVVEASKPVEDDIEDISFEGEPPVEEDLQTYLYPNPTPQRSLTAPSRVKMDQTIVVKDEFSNTEIKQEDNQDLGSIVVLAAVKATGKLKQDLGTERVLT